MASRVSDLISEVTRQRELPSAIDSATFDEVLSAPATNVSMKAQLQLVSREGAGAWLHASPDREKDTILEGELFRTAMKRRLRVTFLERPGFCPMCGSGMDVFMDHARVCSCEDDRTLRHNAIRNLVNMIAAVAGLRPETEKPGLLTPRPEDECLRGEGVRNGRRPADIWVPHWHSGAPAAWDFAVTSGLRTDSLFAPSEDRDQATSAYEAFKRDHMNTDARCRTRGLEFMPLVAEAHGGSWGLVAKSVWKSLSKAWDAVTGSDESAAAAELQQRISVTLQRENARAVLKRLAPTAEVAPEACPDAWLDDDDL